MLLERYPRSRRRWIVGCIAVSIAVMVMLLTPPSGVVNLFLGQDVYWTKRNTEEILGMDNTDPIEASAMANQFSQPVSPSKPSQRAFTYVEEPPVENESKRLFRALSTQGAVCTDLRRIGGLPTGPHGAPRPFGPDGMWYVCFDEEVHLKPGSCVVYSFGTGDDFSFDEQMANFGCEVYAFDPSMGKEDHEHSVKVMFYNQALSDVNQERSTSVSDQRNKGAGESRRRATTIMELGHFEREIDIVKMDIESDEWKCLRHMLADGTLRNHVRQLDVEYHVILTTPNALRQYYSIAKWLERQGFRIFHSRKNPYCPECWEMSYINTNLVDLPLN
ncbi:probable methyltransferase-like protein 24 [Montipora capricornis]|uniref:probable methyltransferase-like protein 24 n=1 Tax=Montipora capricornis TaxID=246305 RepID=UPI0035F11903